MHNTTHYRTLTLFAIMLMMSFGGETCTTDKDPTDEKTSPKKKTEQEGISSTNEADTANKNNGNTPPGNDKKATDEEEDAAKKDQEAVEKKLMNDLSEKLKQSEYFYGIHCAHDLKHVLQPKEIWVFKDVCSCIKMYLDLDISHAICCHDDSIHRSTGPESEAKQKAIKAAIHDPFEKGELQKARDAAEEYRTKQTYRTTHNRFGRIVIYLDFLIKMKQNNL